MRYAICVQNMCRMSAEYVQNECRICAKQGNKIWNKNKNKKGVKLIAATLSRHVASP